MRHRESDSLGFRRRTRSTRHYFTLSLDLITSLPALTKTNITLAQKNKFPSIKFIILSDNDEKVVPDEVVAAEAEGFVLKYRAVLDLISAVREARRGGKYISPGIT
jgi:DNA-binding NarL/FixJ family response regulator